MVRIAIQLHTLHGFSEDLPTTIARVDDTPLEGVEFAGLEGTDPAAVAEALDDASLEVVGAHVPLERFDEEYDAVLETYETIGCRRLIVPWRDPEPFRSSDGVETLARRLSRLASRLHDDGFELLYHNHTFEFDRRGDGGETAYDALVTAAEGVDFEVDTGLTAYGGGDPFTVLTAHADRIPLIHLTDTVPGGATTIQVELGAGELDIERCVETARDVGVEWLVYEHSLTSDPEGSLTHAATRLPILSHGWDARSHVDSASPIE